MCTTGKYLTIPRTEGISTTDIVGRMLLMTKSHHSAGEEGTPSKDADKADKNDKFVLASGRKSSSAGSSDTGKSLVPFDRKTHFLTTSRTIRLFGAGVKVPKDTDRVVYLAGSWDMFHAGHIETLEQARK